MNRASMLVASAGILAMMECRPAAAQELVRTEDAVVALFSLQTELEVDARMLRRMEERLDENRNARIEATDKVRRLYGDLDDLFDRFREAIRRRQSGGAPAGQEPESSTAPGVEELEAQIEAKQLEVKAAERAEAAVREDGHGLRDNIRLQRERMAVLSSQIDSLIATLPAARESVTGLWEITFLPSGDKGIFALFQSGTIVTGQYSLDGPFHGSLEGTLIDRKLLLHRIDARLGRSMDLSATLSSDGQALRGTWENYDLSNGQARTGAWAARRRPARKTPGGAGEAERSEGEGSSP